MPPQASEEKPDSDKEEEAPEQGDAVEDQSLPHSRSEP